jgi:hypothetical protein
MPRRKALGQYFPNGKVASRIRALPDQGCVYVLNPKAGTTSLLLWLHWLHTGQHSFQPDSDLRAGIRLPRVGDVGWSKVLRMLDGEAFRFAFVRHPAARVESAYRSKIAGRYRERFRIEVLRTLGLQAGPEHEISFEQFVDSLQAVDPLDLNLHWRPQHLNLMHPQISFDLVGRIETFDADLKRASDALGVPHLDTGVRNASPRTGPLLEGRPHLLRKVEEVYARDYELYGYDRT